MEAPPYQLFPRLNDAEYEALKTDIANRGVQVPVELDENGAILDGHHRVEIAEDLGIEYPTIVRSGFSEKEKREHVRYLNILRRQLDALTVARLIEEQAAEDGVRLERGGDRRSTAASADGNASDIYKKLGLSERRGQEVRQLARELEAFPILADAVRAGDLPAERARQYVHKAYVATQDVPEAVLQKAIDEDWSPGRLKYEVQAAGWAPVDDAIVLPDGKFQLLYADPPWPTAGGSKANYPTLSITEIENLADVNERFVDDLPDDNSILFMWAVNEYLEDAISVMNAWGFQYKSNLVWDKVTPMGLGAWVRQRHELLLIGTKGSFPHPRAEDRLDSVVAIQKGRHSEKPDEIRYWLERMYPKAAKVELFARTAPDGWAVFGNQAPASGG